MSFLAPLFLAGAAAIALPFLFHLIRRSAKEKIPFGSLMFLEASPPRITRRSRLEHLLLLLLRCAVICLLALAFARPFLSRPVTGAPPSPGSLHLAILIDTSASMQRENLWAQAKARAAEAAREADPEVRVALFAFDRRLRSVLPFSESASLKPGEAAAEIKVRLTALEPGFESTHLGHALTGAAELLLDELNREQHEFGRARILVISDFQEGASLDGLQGFEWPDNLEVELAALEAENKGNAGLHLLDSEVRLAFATTNSPPRVRVQNSAGSTREQFRVSWAENGIPSGEPLPIYVPPGESRILAPSAAPVQANQLLLLDDPVPFDNRAWWTPRETQEITILYHGPGDENSPQEAFYFLKRAFEAPGSALRVKRIGEPVTNQNAGLFIATETLTGEALAQAQATLESGKTVLAVIDRPEAAAAIANLLGVPSLPAAEAEVGNYALLGQIDFSHPLFRPFAEARYSDFTKIHFWKYRRLDLSPLTNAVVPARFDSGDPFMVEVPAGKGRVALMTSGWPPSESQFALSSKFVPLLYRLLEQSLGQAPASQQFLVGEAIVLPETLGAVEEIIAPNGSRVSFAQGSLAEPGIYQAGEQDRFRFAVNVDPAETRVQPLGGDDLQALGIPIGTVAASPETGRLIAERQQHRLASEAEAQQKLWRWLLLAAVVFLFLEMLYAGRLSRTVAAASVPV